MHSNEFCNDYFSPVYFGFHMCAMASYMNMSIENGIDFICNFIENLQQCKIECTPTWLFEILIQHTKITKNMHTVNECGQFHSSKCSMTRSKSILYNVWSITTKKCPKFSFVERYFHRISLEHFSFPRFCCNKFFIRILSHTHTNGLFIKPNKQHKHLTWNK